MTKKNLSEDKVREISEIKKEPTWMTDFRIKSYQKFIELKNPNFGPKLEIDFDIINYYKRVSDEVQNDWNRVDENIKNTFDKIGLIDSEKKYLDGVGAQFESEVVYHNMIQELIDKNASGFEKEDVNA